MLWLRKSAAKVPAEKSAPTVSNAIEAGPIPPGWARMRNDEITPAKTAAAVRSLAQFKKTFAPEIIHQHYGDFITAPHAAVGLFKRANV